MTRTTVDIDDELVGEVMRRYNLKTRREAVDFALRKVIGPRVTTEDILALHGVGWEGADASATRNP